MWHAKHQSMARRYGIAVLSLVGAALVTQAISPLFTYRSPALPFTLAVMLSAWYGGLGPGLFATVLGFLVVDFFFLPPRYALYPVRLEDFVLLGLYAVVGIAISMLTARLSRRRAEIEAVFSAMTDGVIVAMMESAPSIQEATIVSANRAFADMFGFKKPEEVISKRLGDLIDIGDPSRPDGSAIPVEEHPSARAARGESVKDFEVRFRRPGTGVAWIGSCNATPVVDTNGRVTAIAIAIRDVTDRRRAEESQAQRTAQFETLLNAAPMGVYLVDGQLRIREVNPVALPVFGDVPDLIGRDFAEVMRKLWPKAYADELIERFRHTLETGEPYVVPERVEERLDRGVREYYEWQIHRIPLPGGGHGVVCYLRDISAQVTAREQLRRRADEIQTLLDTTPAFVWFAQDPHCKVVTGNRPANQLLDVAAGTNVSQTADGAGPIAIRHFWPDGTEMKSEELPLQRAASSGEAISNLEFEFRLAGDRQIPVVGNAVPLFDDQGKTRGAIGVFLDISARKETEKRFHLAVEAAPNGMVLTNKEGAILLVNAFTEKLFGYTRQELVGQSIEMLLPDGFRAAHRRHRQAFHAEPQTRPMGAGRELYGLRKDGSEFPIEIGLNPIKADDSILVLAAIVDITTRKEAEATSRLLQSVVQSSLDAIISVDLEGVITSWNRGAEHVFGCSAGEVIGRTISVIVPPDHKDEIPAILARIGKGEAIEQYETVRLTKSGKVITVSTTWSPIQDGGGRITGASKIVRDVTAQKQIEAQRLELLAKERALASEKALHESERLFRTFVDHAADALFVVEDTEEGKLVDVNRQACESLGYTREELLGMRASDLGPDADAGLVQRIREVVAAGEVYTFETRHRRKDGSVFPIEVRVRLFSHSGRRLHLALARDITERKRAEEERLESAERFRAIADYTYDWENWIGIDGKLLWVNPAVERITGYSVDECMLMPEFPIPIVAEADRETVAREMRQAVRGSSRNDFEFRVRHKDGRLAWVAASWQPIYDLRGDRLGYRSSIRDIGERKKNQDALREREAELARVLRGLSLGALATSIAHEVNQPLAALVANAQAGVRWLSSRPPNLQEVKQSLDLVVRDGNRASAVIQRIRAFLRKDAVPRKALDINHLVRDSVTLATAELKKRQVACEMTLASGLPRIEGDRIQLEQVILNLVMNAADAMANSSRKELLLESRVHDMGDIIVTVRDSGVGMGQEDLERMFEPFFTKKTSGMGMGLSISRSIIEAHGGRIWAERNDGPGLAIRFTLPVESDAPRPPRGSRPA